MDGSQLRALREYHRLTQAEVARAAGLHHEDVSDVELGKRDSLSARRRVAVGILRATSPSRVVSLHGAKMRRFLEARGAHSVRVIGSAARGTDRWDSDIDILLELPARTSLFDVADWEEHLRRLAGGVRVDLVPDGPGVADALHASGDTVSL